MISRSSTSPARGARVLGLVAALVTVWALLGAARADEFDKRFKSGLQLYEQKDYDGAVKEFLGAYELRQLPRVLLNVAQAYRKQGKAREALAFYERYMKAEPSPPPKIKKDVETYVAQTRALVEAPEVQAAIEREKEPPPKGWNRETGDMEPWLVTQLKIDEQSKPVYKKPWFWGIIGGVVAAGIVTGVVLGVTKPWERPPDGIKIISF